MHVNIATDNDIDINIRKLDEMLNKITLLEDKSKLLNFITIREFAEMRKCSIKIAQDIFNDKTFPSEDYGKHKVVELQALKDWYSQKRSKKDKLLDCSKNIPL